MSSPSPASASNAPIDLGSRAEAFRIEFRSWLEQNAPPDLVGVRWPAPSDSPHRAALAAWAEALCAAGYMCVAWPEAYGGRGLGTAEVVVMNEEFDRAGVPRITRGRAESIVGPAIIAHGTEEQKQYFLPRIISGEHVYCQGFSEPEAGSDLASLRTRGVVDGEELVVTGQKVWTSGFDESTMMFALVRTSPEAPRHAGISYVLIPVVPNGPGTGVEFRALRQMTERSGFAETFLDGARVPLFNVIGGLDHGWQVARTTLGHERGNRATTAHVAYAREFWELVEEARARGIAAQPHVRVELAWAWSEIETMRYAGLDLLGRLAAGDVTESETGAVTKLRWSEFHRRFGELAMEIIGPDALLAGGQPFGRWQEMFLASRAETIWGGTSEVQRNLIAERTLMMPREPRGSSR